MSLEIVLKENATTWVKYQKHLLTSVAFAAKFYAFLHCILLIKSTKLCWIIKWGESVSVWVRERERVFKKEMALRVDMCQRDFGIISGGWKFRKLLCRDFCLIPRGAQVSLEVCAGVCVCVYIFIYVSSVCVSTNTRLTAHTTTTMAKRIYFAMHSKYFWLLFVVVDVAEAEARQELVANTASDLRP